MTDTLKRCLTNYPYFRYGFFTLLTIGVLINCFILQNSNFYILYIISTICLSIGFFNKPTWFLILFTTLIVLCRFYFVPQSTSNIETFLNHLSVYLLITFLTAGLMKNFKRVKTENIELVKALSNALDSRDSYTLHHSENVAKYSVEIAKKMGLSKLKCNNIHIGCLLHDIGKIGIPEHILTKPDKLTKEEYNCIKTHPTIGYNMLKHVESFKDRGILDIILYHHERYDGKGYPTGLKGNQIPLVARIVAVADTFDAMMNKRIYRNELGLDYTLNEIRNNKGTQFDPEIVDVFLELFEPTLVNSDKNNILVS